MGKSFKRQQQQKRILLAKLKEHETLAPVVHKTELPVVEESDVVTVPPLIEEVKPKTVVVKNKK